MPSPRLETSDLPDDAAFTLTEMAASLIVAAMLIGGLGEVTRQFASTMVRVRAGVEETRDARRAQARFLEIERARTGELRVSTSVVEAEIGGRTLRFELSPSGPKRTLNLETDGFEGSPEQRIDVGAAARFELGPDGAARLWSENDEPPLLVAIPRVTAPQDCQFDVVLRDCR